MLSVSKPCSHLAVPCSACNEGRQPWPVCAQGRAKLQEVSHLKEAEQLLRSMLTFKPKGRPSMRAVMSHPFWWSHHQRLSFLIDMSDRMENEDREVRGPPPRCAKCAWLLLEITRARLERA